MKIELEWKFSFLPFHADDFFFLTILICDIEIFYIEINYLPCLNCAKKLAVMTIKFVSDLRQVCGFLRILRFPPPIKLTATI